MGSINSPRSAIDLVILHGPIQTPPKVVVFHRNHTPEVLPKPAVLSPFTKTVTDSFTNVRTRRPQRHTRRLFQRFESPDYREQFEPIATSLRVDIVGHGPLAALSRTQYESPPARVAELTRFRD